VYFKFFHKINRVLFYINITKKFPTETFKYYNNYNYNMENKIIQKLLKKAEIVKNCEIPEENFIDISIEEFIKLKGNIYFDEEKKYFYSNLGKKWFRFKNEEEIKGNEDFIKWANNFKNYVDNKNKELDKDIEKLNIKLNKFSSNQEEFFTEIKKYIDLNIKKLKEEITKEVKEIKKK